MIKVLFVRFGNICRSPMAQFVFKQMVEERGLSPTGLKLILPQPKAIMRCATPAFIMAHARLCVL